MLMYSGVAERLPWTAKRRRWSSESRIRFSPSFSLGIFGDTPRRTLRRRSSLILTIPRTSSACYTLLSVAAFDNDQQYYRQAIEILEAILSSDNLADTDRTAALSCRGASWDTLEQYDRALADHNEAIRLVPNDLSCEILAANGWVAC